MTASALTGSAETSAPAPGSAATATGGGDRTGVLAPPLHALVASRVPWGDLVAAAALLTLAIALPLLGLNRYYLGELAVMLTWMIVAAQWNLLFGVAGVFNLAQMILYASGGYAAAMLAKWAGVPYWAAVPMAGVVTLCFALAIGLACLRLTGAYVALLTLAIAEVVRQLVVTDTACFVMEGSRCVQFAGGTSGLTNFGGFESRAIVGGRHAPMMDYYIMLAAASAILAATYVVMRGPIGLGLRALGNNPGYAVSRGVNRFRFQMIAFGISALFTGLAGALAAGRVGAISPTQAMSLTELLFIIGMVVIGGAGRFWGPILGALLVTALRELTREFGDYRLIGQGLLLALVVLLMPGGVLGALGTLHQRLRRRSTPLPPS